MYLSSVRHNEEDKKLFISDLQNLCDSIDKSSLNFVFENAHKSAGVFDIVRSISDLSVSKHTVPQKNALIQTLHDIDKRYPSSGYIALKSFITYYGLLNKIKPSSIDLKKGHDLISKNISAASVKNSRFTNSETALSIVKKYLANDDIMPLVEDVCTYGGHSLTLTIPNKIYSGKSKAQLKTEYSFDVAPIPSFVQLLGNGVKKIQPKAVLIDGIIESVSEIHHILESANNTKIPVIIFARGFSEEVLGTLYTNYGRGTLDVLPVLVGHDLESINKLVDIAHTCNSDVISSLKGELISSINFDEIQHVGYVVIEPNKVKIHNTSATPAVTKQINNIRNLIQQESNSDKINFYEKRISSLSNRNMMICLGPEHQDNFGIIRDNIIACFGMFSSISRNGIIDLLEDFDDCNSSFVRLLHQSLVKSNNTKFPATSFYHGTVAGISIAKLFFNNSITVLSH
jgi:hypothetical protein